MKTDSRLCLILTSGVVSVGAWVQPQHTGLPRTRRSSSLALRMAVEGNLVLSQAVPVVQSAIEETTKQSFSDPSASTILLSALRTSDLAVAPNTLLPAHGHEQGWFGAPDQYLAAGHSIAPSAKALQSVLPSSSSVVTNTKDLPEALKLVVSKGWELLDANRIQAESFLPGFTPTGGILAAHNPAIPAESSATFAATVDWAASFLPVVDKLPEAAFVYVCIEFFLLRPNLDVYKEEIRQETTAVWVEAAVTTGVRLAAFGVVAVTTLGIFG